MAGQRDYTDDAWQNTWRKLRTASLLNVGEKAPWKGDREKTGGLRGNATDTAASREAHYTLSSYTLSNPISKQAVSALTSKRKRGMRPSNTQENE